MLPRLASIPTTRLRLALLALVLLTEPQACLAANFTVTTTNDSGPGSLRQAILDAVNGTGTKTIAFNITNAATSGVYTINVLSALPSPTNNTVIDGYSQPGAKANSLITGNDAVIKIRLSGAGASGATGLDFGNPGCAVYGLAIVNFQGNGIYAHGSGNPIIQGNFIGLNPDGLTVGTNVGTGIRSTAGGAVIGGSSQWQRNVISGNLGGGISLQNSGTNVIQGNYLGTDASGTLARGNGGFAVQLANPTSTGNLVGGALPGEGNVIAATTGPGSNGHGIYVYNATGNWIQGNFIGTDVSGVQPLGNLGHGILLTNATIDNLIGGTNAGEGNIIVNNARAGVLIASGTNGVLGNSIFANGGLGIDLGNVGVQTNDFADADVGPNNLQNYPVISAATNQAGVLQLTGYFRSRTNLSYRLEFFTSPTPDASTNGEGKNFLGATTISLTTTSLANFVVSFPSIPGGDPVVTATATDPAKNTSEFSSWRAITYTELVLVDGAPLSQTVLPGENASFSIIARGMAPISYQWFLNGAPVSSAGSATLSLPNVQWNQAGIYSVVVSNAFGAVTSAPVALNLLTVPATIVVTNLNDSGRGSFRQAILTANATAGAHTIAFDFAGTGPFTLTPASAYPAITNVLTIDGTTLPGYAGKPLVVLKGSNAGTNATGLELAGTGLTARGLIIQSFGGAGLRLTGAGRHLVESCYVGTATNGMAAAGNGTGIVVESADNVIGGTSAASHNIVSGNNGIGILLTNTASINNWVQGNYVGLQALGTNGLGNGGAGIVIRGGAKNNSVGGTATGARNVISANGWASTDGEDGIDLLDTGTTGNLIQGNFIGTDASGTLRRGNLDAGISIMFGASSNTIGGGSAAARNVIADAGAGGVRPGTHDGIYLETAGTAWNVIQGNFIGTDLTGTQPLGNLNNGIRLWDGPHDNLIGGTGAGDGNLIAYNPGAGIFLDTTFGGQPPTNMALLGNAIFFNSSLGIDLGSGANHNAAAPVLSTATNAPNATRITGTLNSTPGTTFRLEFFANPTSAGGGRKYLGAASVNTDGSGLGTFNVLLATGNLSGQFATATATDPSGNTSEFSAARVILNASFSAEMMAAYEGFDYPVGVLPGGAGGSGWAGSWSNQSGLSGLNLVLGDSLLDPAGTLPRIGNHGGLNATLFDAAALRNLSAPLGANGTTTWISFLLRPDSLVGGTSYGGLVLGGTPGTGTNGLFIGHNFGTFRVEKFGAGAGSVVSGSAPAHGSTAFLVARLDFFAGNDRATLYVNPTPGVTTPDSTYTATFTNLDLGTFTQIKLTGGGLAQQSVDEIRVGASYESVAPWGAPAFIRHPQSQSALAGSGISLNVTAAGTTPLNYQWFFNGVAIPGAISETLVLSNLQFAQSGSYSAVATNIFGAATSQVGVLSVAVGLPGGLSHWWSGDSNALDYIGNNHGTLVNGASYRAGKIGSAFALDGTNDVVDVGSMPWLGNATGLTVMAWIHRTNVVNGMGGILGRWQATGSSNSAVATSNTFLFSCGEGTISNRAELVLQFTNLGTYVVIGATTLPTNQWIHVAATWNSGDGAAAIYLNGARDGATNLPVGQRLQYLPGYTTKIGSWGNSTNTVNQFRGGIDEVLLLDRALSSNEIQIVHASGSAGLAKAPIISQHPSAQAVVVGSNVTLTVSAVGALPLTYQWNVNGTPIAAATNSTFSILNAQSGDSGNYDVTVSNPVGVTLSQRAEVRVVLDVPAITGQPDNTTVLEGDAAVFKVTAVGSPPLTYQWSREGSDLAGQTNSTLTLTNVALADAGRFMVVVSNPSGLVLSEEALLTVLSAPPNIIIQPASRTVNDGTNVSFSVTATGTAPIFYKWERNGAFIAGATNATLNLTNVSLGASGNYTVTVGNAGGSATSAVAVLTVLPVLPAITAQPVSRTVSEGANVSFSVTAAGTPPLSYKWERNATSISGATNASLNLTNVALSASGNYTVVVSNPGGSVTSVVAVLTVQVAPPTIITQPGSRTVKEGTNVSFTVVATGTAPLSFQWTWNTTNLSGATNVSLSLANVSPGVAGNYSVVVSNTAGSVTSSVAVLSVQPVPPWITTQPASLKVDEGADAFFFVVATGTSPLSYQWAHNAFPIAAGTNATLNLMNVAPGAGGNFVVVVSNAAGSVTSAVAVLTVQPVPPTIIQQPASQTAAMGSTATFSVVATGTAPLLYQWQRTSQSLPGETGPTLTLSNLQPGDAGDYRVVVRNAVGSVVSAEAMLTVVLAPLAMTDNLSPVVASAAASGAGYSSNTLATAEGGEPLHDGRPGGKSMWFAWRAPAGGIATFTTAGSDFDTLLAVYQGTAVNALTRVDSDDDEAGFFNSMVMFNVESNEIYQIAVDGSGGVSGKIVLEWSVESTADRLPVITGNPGSRTIARGSNFTFAVAALGTGVTYEWYHHHTPIAGATNNVLVISNADVADVGSYRVYVSFGGRTVKSKPAHLQLNLNPKFDQEVHVSDKFRDIITGGRRLRLDPPPAVKTSPRPFAPAAASRGYTGTQIFSAAGSLKEPGEPDHCGIPGGASIWLAYQADASGVLALNTDGSTFDTVLAVYTGSGTDFASLIPVVCDNNSGTNGVTSSLHFATTSGTTYFIVVDGVNGASGTVVLNYTTLGEQEAPTIAITSAPPANSGLTNGMVTMSGTALDGNEITIVEWRLTNSLGATAWTHASGTNPWTLTASNLNFGVNYLEVRAWDSWANASAVVSRRYIRLAPLTVGINGCGSVSSGYLGTTYREPGATITLAATPCGNSLNAGWSGELATNGATLRFHMPTGLVVQANFATNPFTALSGSYSGLFCDTNALSQAGAGFFSAHTSARGTYSGRLGIGARRYPFSGRLGLDGRATNSVHRDGTNPPLRLELNLNVGESVEWMTGRIFETNRTAELAAYRAVFHARTNPAPYRGRYTLLLPANEAPGTPGGDGYAAVTVSASGSASLSGQLADGTPLTQSARVSREGLWPVFAPLYRGQGFAWSWLAFETDSLLVGTNVVQSDLAGDWRWLRPGLSGPHYDPVGFTNLLTAAGSRYIPPADRTNGACTFSNGVVALRGGNLTAPVINEILRAPNDRITNQGTNKMTLSIRRSSGLFEGSVVVPQTGKTLRFKGAIFQNGDFGSGCFQQTNASGPVWLGPRE